MEEKEKEIDEFNGKLEKAKFQLNYFEECCKILEFFEKKDGLPIKCGAMLLKNGICNSNGKGEFNICKKHEKILNPRSELDCVLAMLSCTLADVQKNLKNKDENFVEKIKENWNKIQGLIKKFKKEIEDFTRLKDVQSKELTNLKGKLKKVKGSLEQKLFDVLEREIKVHYQALYGEMTYNGNDCSKILQNFETLLDFLKEKKNLYMRYYLLFTKFRRVMSLATRIQPLRTYELEEDELYLNEIDDQEIQEIQEIQDINETNKIIEEKLDEEIVEEIDEEIVEENLSAGHESEIDLLRLCCWDLTSFYLKNFKRIPIPKQHFLSFHIPQFVTRWGSLGMFSEQAIESIHAVFNHGKRKYKSMGKERRIIVINHHNVKYSTSLNYKKQKTK